MNAPLPESWRWARLGDVVIEGPANGYSGAVATEARGTPTLRLSATSSGGCVLNAATTKRLIETIPRESDLWLNPGDLLIQRSNTVDLVGTAAVYDGPPETYVYPDLMMRLRFAEPSTARWTWRYMNSPAGRAFFVRMAAGSAGSMPKISGAKLREMMIPLPPLPEQHRIVAILDEADALRRKRREALGLLDEILRATFLEMFGDPVTNPRGWPVVRMDSLITDSQYGTALKANNTGCGLPVLRMNNLGYDGLWDLTDLKFVEIREENLAQFTVCSGDLLFNRTNSPELVGKAGVWRHSGLFAFAGYLIRTRFDRERVLPEFVSGYLNSAAGKRYLHERAKPSNNMSNFSASMFAEIPLILPPVVLQRRFTSVVDCLLVERQRHSVGRATADSLFSSLLDRAFSGRL